MKCIACGVEIRDGARFCPHCGKDQSEQPEQKTCVHCGQPLLPGANFCGYCGGSQTVSSAPAPIEEPMLEGLLAAVQEPDMEAQLVEEPIPASDVESLMEPTTDPYADSVTEPIPAPDAEPVYPAAEEPAAAEAVPAPKEEEEPAPAYEPAPAPVYEPAPVYTAPVYAAAPAREPEPYRYNPAPAPQPQPVVQTVYYPAPIVRPSFQLPEHRAMWKMILLSILTLGIYPLVIWCKISMEMNVVASRHDGEWTMHYMCMLLLAPITLFIYPLVWIHKLCNRTGEELLRRKINYRFSASDFWLWNFLYLLLLECVAIGLFFVLPMFKVSVLYAYLATAAAALISLIGPLVYLHKHMKAMNLINADYNAKG